MRVRVLGAHNLETSSARHTCFLVDDSLAIDAGSLMTSLSSEEKEGLRAILLTHRHYDHLRDLPSLGLATLESGTTVSLYSLPDTLEALSSHLMDGLLYPDLTQRPTPECPKFRLMPLVEGRVTAVAGFQAKAIAVPHSAPAVGYLLRSPQGGTVAFSGDTGGGLLPFFRDPFRPGLFFVDVTFSSGETDGARKSGHLTPALLQAELVEALGEGLTISPIVAVHMDSRYEEGIRQELALVADELGLEISLAREGMEFQV